VGWVGTTQGLSPPPSASSSPLGPLPQLPRGRSQSAAAPQIAPLNLAEAEAAEAAAAEEEEEAAEAALDRPSYAA
jgi:hypothetical protein